MSLPWLLKEVIEASNTPADVPAMVTYSAWINDDLEPGEVIVRAHSTHTVLEKEVGAASRSTQNRSAFQP